MASRVATGSKRDMKYAGCPTASCEVSAAYPPAWATGMTSSASPRGIRGRRAKARPWCRTHTMAASFETMAPRGPGDVIDLRGAQHEAHRNGDRTDLAGGEAAERELDAVHGHQAHPVAGAHAEPAERSAEPVHQAPHVLIGQHGAGERRIVDG